MFDDGDFKYVLVDIMNNPDNYSKEELHKAFLEMTERYLDEMISTLNLEHALTKDLSEEAADDLLNDISMSCPGLSDLEMSIIEEKDPIKCIMNRMDFIECGLGFSLE